MGQFLLKRLSKMKVIIGLFLYLILPFSQSLEEQKFEAKEWTAKWIGAPKSLIPEFLNEIPDVDKKIFKLRPGLKPALYFRKTMTFENVSDAQLYVAAKGAFKVFVSSEYARLYNNTLPAWTPGWTDYNRTIQYYTFDVTYRMQESPNCTVGVMVCPGLYSGYIGDKYNLYGDDMSTLLELHLEFDNGSTTVITTDDTWKVNTGEILYSDFEVGELYYENLTQVNWTLFGYDDSDWTPVITQTVDKNIQFVEDTSPVLRRRVNSARSVWRVEEDKWIYSYGELIYGGVAFDFLEFTFNGRIQVRLGESLYPNGSLYTGNDGTAYTIVLNRDLQYRPHLFAVVPAFSAKSFRYMEVTGYPGPFEPFFVSSFRYAQFEIDATPTTNNRLVTNILRYLKSSTLANMNSIATNNPGENRVGWLEPAGLFSSTALNLLNAKAFYTKWLNDIFDAQASSGAYSNTAPNVNNLGDASPGSGFAPILIAYNLYKYYEDIDVVEKSYNPNKNWLKYIISKNFNFLYTNNVDESYGDYANVNAETPKEVISTAYFAFSSLLMSKMAGILNKSADKDYYDALHKNISSAFVKAYVDSADGKVNGDTQTGYVLALVSKVLPEDLIPKVVQKLVDNIKANNYHLKTGYVGTAFVLPVLADYGHADVAYKLLLQESYPSWGYMLQNANRSGLWERWNSWTDKDGFQGSSLNSVGLASVGNFLYQYIAGINSDENQISFKKVVIKPYIGEGISSFNASIETNYGSISSSWNIKGNVFNIEILTPQNTTGKLILPFAKQTWIRELSPGKQQFQFSLNTNRI